MLDIRALSLRLFAYLLGVLLFGVLAPACTSGIDIRVIVSHIPADAKQLRLLVRVDKQDAMEMPSYDVTGKDLFSGYRIGLHLPEAIGSSIVVAVAALNSNDPASCLLATGSSSSTIDGRQLDLVLNLDQPYAAADCHTANFFTLPMIQQIFMDQGKLINRIDIEGWNFLTTTEVLLDGQIPPGVNNYSGASMYISDADVPIPTGSKRATITVRTKGGEMVSQPLDLVAPIFKNMNTVIYDNAGAPVVDYVSGVASGDVNGDGKEDLVMIATRTTSPAEDFYSVFLNDGHGGFPSTPTNHFTLQNLTPRYVSVVDLDVKGPGEIVISGDAPSNRGALATFSYNGGTPIQTNRIDFSEPGVAHGSGKFHAPNRLDVVVLTQAYSTTASSGNVSMLLNNGSGTLAQPTAMDNLGNPRGLAVADVNGDGLPDLVTHSGFAVNVSLNNNTTAELPFAARNSYLALSGIMKTADLNGDNKADVIVGHSGGLLVFWSQGASLRFPPEQYDANNVTDIAAEDWNGDGFPDVALVSTSVGLVSMLYNTGDFTGGKIFPIFKMDATSPTLLRAPSYPISSGGLFQYATHVATGDVNGDGKRDVIISNYGSTLLSQQQGSLQLLLNVSK